MVFPKGNVVAAAEEEVKPGAKLQQMNSEAKKEKS